MSKEAGNTSILKGILQNGLAYQAVRFGRVPKREKAKILAAMQSSRMKTQESKVMGELNDDAKKWSLSYKGQRPTPNTFLAVARLAP